MKTQTDTLNQIRADSEFCSDHLHNTLAESKACKRSSSASVASDSPNITTRQATVFEIKTGLIGAGFFAKCGSVYTGGWSTERKAFNAARAQLRKRNPDATFKQILN